MDAPVYTITHDIGGYFGQYRRAVEKAERNGTLVRIDGLCASACTMYLRLPPGRVCITPRARLLFHQGIDKADRRHEAATQWLFSQYPVAFRQWIAKRGGLTHRDLIMDNATLASFLPRCK